MQHKWIIVCFLFLFTALANAAEEFFSSSTIQANGQVQYVQPACLSGGKEKELIIASRLGEYPNYKSQISVWQNDHSIKSYDFDQAQPLAIDLIGNCQGTPKFEQLAFIYPDKIEISQSEHNITLPIPKCLLVPESGSIPLIDLLKDFNGDGSIDLLLPTQAAQGLEFISDVLGKSKRSELNYPLKNYLRANPINQPLGMQITARQSRWLPQAVSADYNGDGKLDLILAWQDELTIYQQDAQRNFSAANKIVRPLSMLSEEDRSDLTANAITNLGNSGNDPYIDILANRTRGSIAALKTLTRLTLRGKDGEVVRELSNEDGNASSALWIDVNNDGRMDIVTVAIQTGVFATIQALLGSSVDAQFNFYFAKEDGSFSERADYERELGFKFNLRSFTPLGFLPSLSGDFNGDGLRDAIFGKDSGHLYLITQRQSGNLFPETVTYKGKVEVSELFVIDDLNGDKRSDIVFWYRDWPRRSKVLALITNLQN